jgi:surface carbohydrate biosynthesis protein (TIGR04326 family)
MLPDNATLLILGDDAPGNGARAWRWDGPGDGNSSLVVDYLEANGDEIRRRYLAWVHELGETPVNGTPLRAHFAFHDGVNPWSTSVFVEQSPWRQRSVEPILKVMAIDLLMEREPPARMRYAGADGDLAQVLRAICRRRGVPFEATLHPGRTAGQSWRHRLPQWLQGLLGLALFAITRVPLRPARPEPDSGGLRIAICAPYFNNNGADAGAAEFQSRFWTVLPAQLESGGYRITWLHSFYVHATAPDVATAHRQIRRIDGAPGAHGRHYLLESFLTAGGWLRVAARWFATAARSFAAGRELARREPYWPMMKPDWAKAFRGAGSLEALSYAECYARAFERMPRQHEGLYLMECQGWERALIQAWRSRGHGRLAGAVHSTIRYWDLRYHADPRRDVGPARLPSPDVVLVNGAESARQYRSTSPAREPLVDVEALRYLHLARLPPRREPSASALVVLVLGDYLLEGTLGVMKVVEAACGDDDAIEVRVKPHPNCPVDPAAFPRLRFGVATGEVLALSRESHVVVSGNLTSAAVDAYVGGARVLVLDDGRGINCSPLRGAPGVTFIRDVAQLRAALESARATAATPGDTGSFFHVDTALPRWRGYFCIEQSS